MRSGWWVEKSVGLAVPRVFLLFFLVFWFADAGLMDAYRLHRAQALQREGRYAEALALYRDLPSNNDALRYNRANLSYRLGDYDEALRLYRSVEAPELEGAKLYNMGNCYAKKGLWAKAERFYRAALKFLPDDSDLRENLRIARKRVRQLREEARSRLQKEKGKEAGKSKGRRLGVRRGVFEGSIDFDKAFEGNDTLEEARFGDTLVRRGNLARRSGSQGRGREESRKMEEENRTIVAGDEKGVLSLERERYERALAKRPLGTLTVPMNPKKERKNAVAW
ncbi:tetratricopeptide repeat protein [Nitratifractor sp.]|uniref:tetratricopeptide repeat protein n=1 Tax=Nitratifractor sp. TaxID=2268144 RepID=UPI0025FCE454|nr:tetratricopeptide repeat protein [Nitratifractor sp.]